MLVTLREILPDAKKNRYAVGLFNTAVNIILLLIVNKIASKASDVEFV